MEITDLLEDKVIENIKKDIEDSNGQEVFLLAYVDRESGKINDYNLLARGNKEMVPAIINDLKPGTVIIHNHPSGVLEPSAADIRVASRAGNNGIGFAIINNEVSEVYVVVEPKIPREEVELDEAEIISLFEPGGELDQKLKDYEYREQQIKVVKAIINSFNEHKSIFIEAGTGTGKSFAYLIPALHWANLNEQPVVVSTNTINLQEQLIDKDLVLLKKVLPFSFKAVLVKGRGNYVCKRKQKNLEERAVDLFLDEPDKRLELMKVLNWLDETGVGSKSEINFVISPEIWEELASESDLCLRTNCPFFDSCFFMEARKEVFSADLLIVNHHLLLSDAVLKNESGGSEAGILPKYRRLIIDEAHNLVDTATAHLGKPFYVSGINKYLQRLYQNKYSLIPRLREKLAKFQNKGDFLNRIDSRIIPQILKINDLKAGYFNNFKNIVNDEEKIIRVDAGLKERQAWQELEEYGEKFQVELQKLGLYLNELYEEILKLDSATLNDFDEYLMELESFTIRVQIFANNLDFNLLADDPGYVFWIEKKQEGVYNQENAPLDISDLLNELLWDSLDSLVLTSATLSINKDFRFFKETLGLDKSETLEVESPFDYAKQARLIIPDDIPEASSPGFLENIIEYLQELLLKVGGRTLVLFTAYNMLNYCVDKLSNPLQEKGISLLAQGSYPRNYILERFKENDRQIIFGTDSFWEGVDIKGDKLQCLIIMRLPFPVPTEPVTAARMELLKKAGKNPFMEYSLPWAVIKFKQGFGRLIRSKQDKGIIISFDNRLISKKYGRIFLNSLPAGCPIERKSIKTIIKEDI